MELIASVSAITTIPEHACFRIAPQNVCSGEEMLGRLSRSPDLHSLCTWIGVVRAYSYPFNLANVPVNCLIISLLRATVEGGDNQLETPTRASTPLDFIKHA